MAANNSPKKTGSSSTDLIIVAVVAVVTVVVGGYLTLHGSQTLGATMIGAVVTAFFLHVHASKSATLMSQSWETAITALVPSVLDALNGQKASSGVDTTKATIPTTPNITVTPAHSTTGG